MRVAAVLGLLLVLAVCAAAAPAWRILDAAPVVSQRCVVCGQAMTGAGDMLIQFHGRSVAVCSKPPCLEAWRATPEAFFGQVQARSALFDEAAMAGEAGRPVSMAWIALGIYMLAGTIGGAVCAYLAIKRGLSPITWFALGVAFNILALGAILTRRGDTTGLPQGVPGGLRKVPTTRAPRPCPACGAQQHPSASACSRCSTALDPISKGEVSRA